MITITCIGNRASCTHADRLTSGMVGLQCEFVFDEAWDRLSRTAVFLAGDEKRDVLITGDRCTVPWEVMKDDGNQLTIGVYGTNAAGTLVIPTVYASCGTIAAGADPSGDESTDPTLPVWAQLLSQIGNLDDLDTAAKDNLVAAINEAAQSGGGGGTSDHSKLANRDAENQHPISAIAGLQTALDGKQPSGDYALRSEIPSVDGLATKAYVDNNVSAKQDTITDLAAIRSGAEKGATALQEVPDGYATEEYVKNHHDDTKQPIGDYALRSELVTDEHINALIDNKLGVIENGSY